MSDTQRIKVEVEHDLSITTVVLVIALLYVLTGDNTGCDRTGEVERPHDARIEAKP